MTQQQNATEQRYRQTYVFAHSVSIRQNRIAYFACNASIWVHGRSERREKHINGCEAATSIKCRLQVICLCWIVIDPKHLVLEPNGAEGSRNVERERDSEIPTLTGNKGGK